MKHASRAILILPLLLLACAVGPDYEKPEVNIPEGWRAADIAKANEVEQNWWKNFNDPVLNQLVEKATAGNFDLKIADARISQARAASSSADAALLPTGDVTASGNRQANRIAFPGGDNSSIASLIKKPFNTFQTGFDASWELDLFGGHKREAEAANAEVEASQASYDDVMVRVLAEVARTYVEIRQYQAQIKIAEATLAADQRTFNITGERVEAGEAPGLDATQAEAELKKAQAQLPNARNMLAQAEYSMDVLLGEQPGATAKMISTSGPIPTTDKKLVLAAPAAVMAQRPDIRIAERKLAAATARQGAALAKFFPDVSITGFFGLLDTNVGNLLDPGNKSWMMGGNVLWPILSYGSLSANLKNADAQQQEALATYQKTVIGGLSEIEKALTAWTDQDENRQALAQSVDANRHAYDIANERYKQGLTSFLEVLDAERTLHTSEMDLNQANAQTSANLVAVYKSLGGGWKRGS